MKFTFEHWEDDNSLEKLFPKIMTGKNVIEEFIPDINLLSILNDYPQRILDFGCGIGRNTLALCQDYPTWSIVGYDNKMMLEKMEEYSQKKYNKNMDTFNNLKLTYDWEEIKKMKFDWIVCIIVLQHIKEIELEVYLDDFKCIGSKLLVIGRAWLDEVDGNNKNKNVEEIMKRHNLIPKVNLYAFSPVIHGIPQLHSANIYEL